jgi:YD repeat-containing protein
VESAGRIQVGGQSAAAVSQRLGPEPGRGIGGLLSITDHLAAGGPKTYYPFYDGNGNVMGLSDSNGTVVATYKYDPFGKVLESAGPAAEVNPFRGSTKYYDADTQLSYFGYQRIRPTSSDVPVDQVDSRDQ